MNRLKRILSCASMLGVCLLANMGVDVKATPSMPILNSAQELENIKQQNENFILYSGSEVVKEDSTKLADHYSHYSHSSHYSHRSHYSSRF